MFRVFLSLGSLNATEFSLRWVFKLMVFETLLITFLAEQQQKSLLSRGLFWVSVIPILLANKHFVVFKLYTPHFQKNNRAVKHWPITD